MANQDPEKEEGSIPSDEEILQDGGIEVNLEESSESKNAGEETTPSEKQEAPSEPKYATYDDLKKVQNSIAYQTRILQKALNQQPSQTSEPVRNDREPDEIDRVAERDWKEGVRMVIQDEYKTLMEKDKADAEKRAMEDQSMATMEANKQYVVNQYPELSDDGSDITKLYIEASNELASRDSGFFGNPYGPIAAMRVMEEKMRNMGIPLPGVKEQADREITRRARVGATSSVPSKKPSGKFVLTSDQKQFCDQNNIPYEVYAKNASALDKGESLEA